MGLGLGLRLGLGLGLGLGLVATRSAMVALSMFREAHVSRWTEMILGMQQESRYVAWLGLGLGLG